MSYMYNKFTFFCLVLFSFFFVVVVMVGGWVVAVVVMDYILIIALHIYNIIFFNSILNHFEQHNKDKSFGVQKKMAEVKRERSSLLHSLTLLSLKS